MMRREGASVAGLALLVAEPVLAGGAVVARSTQDGVRAHKIVDLSLSFVGSIVPVEGAADGLNVGGGKRRGISSHAHKES